METSNLVWWLLVLGGLLIVGDLMRIFKRCPPAQIVYRYIPRTFDEEQDDPIRPSEVFQALFEKSDPWTSGLNYEKKPEQKNQFWITQG